MNLQKNNTAFEDLCLSMMLLTPREVELLCDSLVSNIRYQFKVTALNQVGQSAESEIASQVAA